jgi:hypothetical protein
MNRRRVGEDRGGKETDRCPLTVTLTAMDSHYDSYMPGLDAEATGWHGPQFFQFK